MARQEWILFYTLAMIVGVRPEGEMERMQKELADGNTVFTDTGFTVIAQGVHAPDKSDRIAQLPFVYPK